MRTATIRALLGAIGIAVAAYGGWLLVSRENGSQLVDVLEWFVGGILLHDGVIAPVVVLAGWLATRRASPRVRGAAAMVLIVLGPLTLIAIPVFEDKGPDSANRTINARDYGHGWLGVALVTAVVVAAWMLAGWRGRRQTARIGMGDSDGHPGEEDRHVPRTRRR